MWNYENEKIKSTEKVFFLSLAKQKREIVSPKICFRQTYKVVFNLHEKERKKLIGRCGLKFNICHQTECH